jgi:hypothetical protein
MLINGTNVRKNQRCKMLNLLSWRYDKKLGGRGWFSLRRKDYFCAVNFYRLSLLLAA